MTNHSIASVNTDHPEQMSSIISLVCRICYDTEKDEELITPCNCKGTVAFVHRSCLETWLGESNTTTCELCHQVFNTERTPKYTSAQSVWYWCWRNNGTSQEVRSDLIACTIITPLTIIITYVCLFSSEYYNQIKFSSVPAARWTSVSLLIMIGIMLIGYYMWVYSAIRMHARRWYNWWQRSCNVRYIAPGPVIMVGRDNAGIQVNEIAGNSDSAFTSTVIESGTLTSVTIEMTNHFQGTGERQSNDMANNKSIRSGFSDESPF